MNLHGLVRGAITSVNPDIPIIYLQSAGNTVATGGKQTAAYASPVTILGQVQAVNGDDLSHYDFLNSQGIYRAVYFYGNIQAIVRSMQRGGDLVKFPQVPGAPVETWLVKAVDETWDSWCRVIVVLQLDPNNP